MSRPANQPRFLPAAREHQSSSIQLKRCCIVLLSFLVLFSALSCRTTQESQNPERTSIRIGYLGDLSGRTFNFGQSALNGLLMAVGEINRAGGINGKRVDVVIEDDQGSPERAATLVSKLIGQDKVVAVIVGGASGSSLAAAPRAQAAQIPMVSPSATDPAVTRSGDFIFRVCYTDNFQGEMMARYATGAMKARKAAILVDFNNTYSRGLSEFFEMGFTKLGGQIVSKQSYAQGDPDFRGQLSAIRNEEPDVIFVPGYYGDVGLIIKQARQLGLTQTFLGGDGWDAPELWALGGAALNGSFISNHYSADDPSTLIQQFVTDYRLLYNNLTPDAHAALGYDALRFVAEGILRAGTTEGPKVREALSHTKDFAGVTGVINLDAERNAIKPAVVLKLEDAQYIYQETVPPPGSNK